MPRVSDVNAERLRYRDNGIRVAGSEVIRNYVERRESDVSLARVLSSQVIRLLWVGRCDLHKTIWRYTVSRQNRQ